MQKKVLNRVLRNSDCTGKKIGRFSVIAGCESGRFFIARGSVLWYSVKDIEKEQNSSIPGRKADMPAVRILNPVFPEVQYDT